MKETTTRASKEALFCIGSNCGDREANVSSALDWLSELLTDFRHSRIYASPDCLGGMREYLNAVAVGKSDLSQDKLNTLCKKFEFSRGRDSKARERGEVPVDVDIVVYDGEVLKERDFASEFFLIGYRQL